MHHAHDIVEHSSNLLRWIPLLPLFGAAINFLVGRRIQAAFGRAGVAALASILPIVSFLIVVMHFQQLRGLPVDERVIIDNMWKWIHIGPLVADIALQFDPLSAVMALVVTGIGSIIHIYSYGYMDHEPAAWRFFALLNLFMFAMLTLVLGDNLLVMFLGWEGVGLCSWGLIGFWYTDHANATAGNKAFLVNRIGDFAFVIGMFLLFWSLVSTGHGTIVFRELAENVKHLDGMTLWGASIATLVSMFFFIGATGKSAQIPLYVWLPDAMAGPTPVSALIHAATMVTAGVYMIGRLNFLFSMSPFTMEVITVIGALTAFFAATIGLTQYDIKKVLAYSTVSQLGYMFMAMGVGAFSAGIFHLVTHAFFKACLFLGSGSVIHAMHHEQDMRKMGGLMKYMPITGATFLVSTIAIAGIPPFSGFFSKDEILWKVWLHNPVLWSIGFLAAGMTAFYMFRQVFMTFFGECRADEHTKEHLHESSPWMTMPLVVLAFGAVVAGGLNVPHALMDNANHFDQWLAPVLGGHGGEHALVVDNESHRLAAAGAVLPRLVGVAHAADDHAGHGHDDSHAAHGDSLGAAAHGDGHAEADAHGGAHGDLTTEYLLMLASIAIASFGIFLAYLMYGRKSINPETFTAIGGGVPHRVIFNKYYVDEFYYGTFLAGTLGLSKGLAWFDKTVVDGVVNGAATVMRVLSRANGAIDTYVVDGAVNAIAWIVDWFGNIRKLQTGSINAYLYVIVIVVTAVLFAQTW